MHAQALQRYVSLFLALRYIPPLPVGENLLKTCVSGSVCESRVKQSFPDYNTLRARLGNPGTSRLQVAYGWRGTRVPIRLTRLIPLSRLASTCSVPRERSTLHTPDPETTFPGLGSVPCAAQSDVSQSDTSPATPAPTTPFARLLPARATFTTHGPYTVRAFKTVAQSASRVRVQSLQVTPTEQLELDGTHWALLRCRRSCRADRGRRRRRCNCCHRRRHLR